MCEPLRGKKIQEDCGCYYYEEDDVKSAVKFYKKYRHDRNSFAKDYPKKYNEYLKIDKDSEVRDYWSCWLFDYCFGDVVDGI